MNTADDHDRHREQDSPAEELPTMALAEPRMTTGDPQAQSADRSAVPTAAEHPDSTGPARDGSTAASDLEPDTGRHAEPAGSERGQTPPAQPHSSSEERAESDPAPMGSRPAAAGAARAANSEPSSEASLFAADELAGLRARWDTVQAGFVDDPRECVHRADGLVSDVVGQLTNGFTQARSRLEDHWGRGEEASTEDLRVALTRYRDFFERLLAV